MCHIVASADGSCVCTYELVVHVLHAVHELVLLERDAVVLSMVCGRGFEIKNETCGHRAIDQLLHDAGTCSNLRHRKDVHMSLVHMGADCIGCSLHRKDVGLGVTRTWAWVRPDPCRLQAAGCSAGHHFERPPRNLPRLSKISLSSTICSFACKCQLFLQRLSRQRARERDIDATSAVHV